MNVGMVKEEGYICNLVIPGFPKSGTSSFHDYLSQHPNIYMSNRKEPHFFSISKKWASGMNSHNELFQKEKDNRNIRYFGESSTTYCISKNAIRRISDCLSRPRIIFVMRHPVERTISHYQWLYSKGIETRPILKAIEQSGEQFDPDENFGGNYMGYLSFSHYSRHLPLWLEVFGKENIHLVNSARLKADPHNTLNTAYDFLGLSSVENVEVVMRNVTENTGVLTGPWATRAMRKLAPSSLRSLVRSNKNLEQKLLKAFSLRRIVPPVIKKQELERIRGLLGEESSYFDFLFGAT